VCEVLAGANPLKFTKQMRELGFTQPLVGGATVADDTIVGAFGDEADGLLNTNPYSLDQDTEANHRFIAAIRSVSGNDARIGHYAACFYVDGMVIEAALQLTGGKSDDRDGFAKAVRTVTLAETPRGPISFDDHGNAVIDVFLRRVEKQNGKMANKTLKTFQKVSQFGPSDPKWFLQQPVFNRDYPPTKS
jgi:branched-chain amino acid transport system substrate-binding protein